MDIIDPVTVKNAVLISSTVTENDHSAYSSGTTYALGDRVIETSPSATVTISIASPCVVTWTSHGRTADTPVAFTTTGALPSGITSGTEYYVIAVDANTFKLAEKAGGAAINTFGSQSGTHTATARVHKIYESLAGSNLGNPLSDTTKWLEVSATNRWKMFDSTNSSQTENADSIVVTLEPVSIVTGIYLGNLDADSVTITVTDATEGVVYTETQSLLLSTSGSSFWYWCFGWIQKKTAIASISLPPYSDASIQITITKTGGIAKCGQCVVGRVVDGGTSLQGLGTDIRDFSTVTFNADGTSTTTERGYSKRMTVDVMLDNDVIDSLQNTLASFRQKNVAWIGSVEYESTMIFGRYGSFKNIIEGPSHSKMALTIEGVV